MENQYLHLNNSVHIQNSVLENTEDHWVTAPLDTTNLEFISNGENEVELIIGLDFGTTFCKVVLREAASGRAWAVPFSASPTNPYLLCTTIWKRNKCFTLMRTDCSVGNLKMALFNSNSSLKEEIDAAVFIGLVLRYVKTWFLINKTIEYPNSDFIWVTHMGLPAQNFQNIKLVEKFRKVLWAGMLLAEQFGEEIEEKDVYLAVSAISKAIQDKEDIALIPNWGSVHNEQVDIFPEIAAQIYGYLKSDLRDPSQEIFMLVDVGGGTVDAAIFRVLESKKGQPQFIFWISAVKALGVYVLHRERLAWHLEQINRLGTNIDIARQLQQILDKNYIPNIVPGTIQEYLVNAEYSNVTCDDKFRDDFSKTTIWDEVIRPVKDHLVKNLPNNELPFLLCGGGRSIKIYNEFWKKINSPNSGIFLKLHQIEIRKPTRLEPRSITNDQYHRLSVAYGLSFDDIGTIVTPDKLIPIVRSENSDISDRYTRKEDT